MEKRQENKDKNIKCPELQDGKQILCMASSKGLIIPSIGELVNFCLSGQYKNCPVKTEKRRGGENEYRSREEFFR